MTTELSSRQREMLAFIREYIGAFGYPPSYRDIMAGTEIASTSNVAYQLRLLRARGVIDFVEGISRSVRLLDDATASITIPLAGRLTNYRPLPTPPGGFPPVAIAPAQLMGARRADAFAVRVEGWWLADSARGIANGDLLIVDRGGKRLEFGASYITWDSRTQQTEIVEGRSLGETRTISARLRCLVRTIAAP